MAKEWTKGFYNSPIWRQQRVAFAQSRHWLCERCGRAGKIVHHIVPLTPDNIRDPKIALSFGNLELVCHTCHNDEHLVASAAGDGMYFDDEGDLVQAGGGRGLIPPGVGRKNRPAL